MLFQLAPPLADMGSSLLSDASYLWVIIFLILTGCGLPIPEEVGIIAAGVWAADGAMDFWLGLLACLGGCIVGDSIMYAIGYRFGKSVLREHPRVAGFLTPEREKRIEQLIRRRGAVVLFTARFLLGVRGPVYLTAGILHYPYRRFFITDLICATIVVSLFYSLAWWFGQEIIDYIRRAEAGVTIAVAIAVVIGVILFWLHRRRSKQIGQSLETLEHASEVLAQHHAPEEFTGDAASAQQDVIEGIAGDSDMTGGNGADQESTAKAEVRERLPQDQ